MSEMLRMVNISKHFPGVKALDRVTFSVNRGEVHALVGENGAGKSTLMKILAGALQPDEGEIFLEGERVSIPNPQSAWAKGISIIYQELNLLPDLNVVQNIFLGREPRGRLGTLKYSAMVKEAESLLERVGIRVPLQALVRSLSVAEQQQVEIAKALSLNAKILVMDEPTASLSETEVERLFAIIRDLKGKGVTVIYISHRLDEVFRIADRVTVLKDGRCVGTYPIGELDREKLVRLMVGRSFSETFPPKAQETGPVILEVRNLTVPGVLKNVTFCVRAGEIVGFFGLVGSGRTDLAKALFGLYPHYSGEILVKGKRVNVVSPQKAVAEGIGFVPEDRKSEGLCLGLSVRDNCLMAVLDDVRSLMFLDRRKETAIVQRLVTDLRIKTPHFYQRVRNLSGGNQQKVVLAKWLATQPDFLIFDEPTRGIDVGAKAEIYHLMRDLARQGKGILMISSELPEILGMSDRIYVMHEGAIVKEFGQGEPVDEERVMYFAAGLHVRRWKA
jgi:ABC-type sugar transport system ATPase subunit